jgi:hypothetical protein
VFRPAEKYSRRRDRTVEVSVCNQNAIPTRAIALSCVGAQMTRPAHGKQSPEPNRNCSSMISRSATANCRNGSYALHEYAYDWDEDLIDLVRRFIDYQDQADAVRREVDSGEKA